MKPGRRRVGSRVAGINIGIAAFCACASDSFQPPRPRPRPRLRPCLQLMNNDERLAPSSTTMTNDDVDESRRPQFIISGPTRLDDYEEVGRLLCEAFDDQAALKQQQRGNSTRKGAGSSVFGAVLGDAVRNLLWNVGITRTLAAAQYTNRYISNARKMRGKKYALLVAKSFGTTANRITTDGIDACGKDSDSKGIKPGQVVAMAEIGISKYRILRRESEGSSDDRDDETDVLASIGVVCVAESQQRNGAASELIKAVESVARRRWNETSLHAAVEESNSGALRFFDAAGYEDSGLVVEVEVSERMKGDVRPHVLLRKRLLPAR